MENVTKEATPVAAVKEAPAMQKVFGGDVLVDQPRALFIPKPAWFFFEPKREVKLKDLSEEGTGQNKYEVGDHQFDPNRPVSHAPMMPHIPLMRETGNPYCADEIEAAKMLGGEDWTTKKWKPYVKLSRAVFNMLTEAPPEGVTATSIVEAAVKVSGVGLNKAGEISSDAVRCAMDTLRDLRLFGLASSSTADALAKKTVFKPTENWSTVELLSEVKTIGKARRKAA